MKTTTTEGTACINNKFWDKYIVGYVCIIVISPVCEISHSMFEHV